MYLLFYAFIFWVPLFSGSWIPASQLKIRTDSVVPESLYLNSIIIGSLYPFFKIRTKMAVHGSLYPFLKIRAKMAVHGSLFQNSDQNSESEVSLWLALFSQKKSLQICYRYISATDCYR